MKIEIFISEKILHKMRYASSNFWTILISMICFLNSRNLIKNLKELQKNNTQLMQLIASTVNIELLVLFKAANSSFHQKSRKHILNLITNNPLKIFKNGTLMYWLQTENITNIHSNIINSQSSKFIEFFPYSPKLHNPQWASVLPINTETTKTTPMTLTFQLVFTKLALDNTS